MNQSPERGRDRTPVRKIEPEELGFIAAVDRVICAKQNKKDKQKKSKAIESLMGSPKKLINKVSLRV